MKKHANTWRSAPGSGILSRRRHKHCIRLTAALLLLTASSLLSGGCARTSSATLSTEADGSIQIGSTLRIRSAPAPLSLYDSKDALAADGLYYASWIAGDSTKYVNEDGNTVDLYLAQATLLISERKVADAAKADIESWRSASKDNYRISDSRTQKIAGQEYEIITYTMKNENSPWSRGVSAFAVHENAAVCVEVTCQSTFTDDPDRILTQLLNRFEYR